MQEIGSNIIIFSYIAQTNKKEIEIDEILKYINVVRDKLKGTNYYTKKINKEEIIRITSMFPSICRYSNSKVFIDNIETSHRKINNFFLKDVSEEITCYLVKGEKFIFPIVYENNIILYEFNSNDKILNNMKEELYYDGLKNNGYIIDMETSKKYIANSKEYIISILFNSKILKTDVLEYNSLVEFIDYIKRLTDSKYKRISEYFSVQDDLNKTNDYCKVMDEYCLSATNNSQVLSLDKEKLKILLGKFK